MRPPPSANPVGVDLVLAADRRVVLGLAVVVRSALELSSVPLHVHVLAMGLRRSDEHRLRESWRHPRCAAVEFHTTDTRRLWRLKTTRYHRSPAMYARLMIDEFLPQAARCVYLDTDVIVCDDIGELARVGLDGSIVAAVCEVQPRDVAEEQALRLGLKDASRYFNSGVMVIDLGRWRKEGIGVQCLRVAREHFDRIVAPDQDVLNMVLDGRVHFVDPKWNRFHWQADPSKPCGIVHLMGPAKPWHAGCKSPFIEAWFAILDRTAFAGWRPRKWWGLAAILHGASRRLPSVQLLWTRLRHVFLGD